MLEAETVLQGRYRVISQLGQGGMGAVYYAWDMRLSVPVALKEMSAQASLDTMMLDELRAQFQQEAQVLARLNHPNLVAVTDFFQESGNAYLVMKYVEGESLAHRVRRVGALPEREVLEVARQLLDALAYCHDQGVIHRDVKPENIILRPDGQIVLVDFGLVKLWDPQDPRTQTAIRGVGTPRYAPPEQYETAVGHTGPRSDLYSVGATLYYALTGSVPPTATLRIASPESFKPLRSVVPGVSNRTANAIERAVELARADRWEDALSMANALGLSIRTLGGDDRAAWGSETVRMSRGASGGSGGRGRFVWWVVGALGLAVLGGGALGALLLSGLIPLPFLTAPVDVTVTATPKREATATFTRTPTSTPSPTQTETSSSSVTLTSTPTPENTATATPEPTQTPTSTPTVSPPTPTMTPSNTPESTPTLEPSPSATPEPVTIGGTIGFETWGTWRRGDQPNGELVQTQDQVRVGTYAAKLTYAFPSSGDDYVVFVQPQALAGEPDRISVWVYGDGSGHFLNVWVQDAQEEIWSVNLGTVGAAGWAQMTGTLAPDLEWPNGRISGPDNGAVDYPVRFYALVLDRPGTGALQGEIILDEIEAWASE